jgi:hypothetical protein
MTKMQLIEDIRPVMKRKKQDGMSVLLCPDGGGRDGVGAVANVEGTLLVILRLGDQVRSIARREGDQWITMPLCEAFTARDAEDDADAIEVYLDGRLFARLQCFGWRDMQ